MKKSERKAVLAAMDLRASEEEEQPMGPLQVHYELLADFASDPFLTYPENDADVEEMATQWAGLVLEIHNNNCKREAPVKRLSDCPGVCHAVLLQRVIQNRDTGMLRRTNLLWGDCLRSTFYAKGPYEQYLSQFDM